MKYTELNEKVGFFADVKLWGGEGFYSTLNTNCPFCQEPYKSYISLMEI